MSMQTPMPPPLPPETSPNWWSRNWKWFVPLLSVASIVAIGGFVVLVFGFIKSSDAYKGAVARVKDEPAVVAVLGSPITEGMFVTGNVSVSGPSGNAELAIPIKGPKGSATVYVEATKRLGTWHFSRLIVEIDATHQRIDLSRQEEGTKASEPTPTSGSSAAVSPSRKV